MKRLSILFLMVVFLASCAKHDLIPATSTYTFTNNTPARITLDLYGSQNDYDHLINRLARDTIAVGAKKAIPLEALRHYWVDWYSDNYCFSNWLCGNIGTPGAAIPVPELAVAAANDGVPLSTTYRDTVRAILFDGNRTESTWQMLITNALAVNGLHTFLFRKNFTGTYTFAREAGDTVVQEFAYFMGLSHITYFSSTSCVDPQISLYPPDNTQAQIATMITAFYQTLGDQILQVILPNGGGTHIAHRL